MTQFVSDMRNYHGVFDTLDCGLCSFCARKNLVPAWTNPGQFMGIFNDIVCRDMIAPIQLRSD